MARGACSAQASQAYTTPYWPRPTSRPIWGIPETQEGSGLFNDALSTFHLQLYGVSHMVKYHTDSERGRKEGNVLFNDALNTFYLRLYGEHSYHGATTSHSLLVETRNSSIGPPWRIHPTDTITHTTAFVTPLIEHLLEQEIVQCVQPHEGSIRWPIAPWANALTPELHLVPLNDNSAFNVGIIFT